jgi:hypothetical protein
VEAPQHPSHGEVERSRDGPGQPFCLIVAPGPPPRSAQRNPRDGHRLELHGRWRRASESPHHPGGDGSCRRAQPRELQAHQRLPRWPVVQERGARPRDRSRRTVETRLDAPLERSPASLAPRRSEERHLDPASRAERPGPAPAPGAGRRKEDVEQPAEHAESVRPGSDTPRPLTRPPAVGSEKLHGDGRGLRARRESNDHFESMRLS